MKERLLQQLKESDLKLTDAQADAVISINVGVKAANERFQRFNRR